MGKGSIISTLFELFIDISIFQDWWLFFKLTIIAFTFKTLLYTSWATRITAINNSSNQLEMQVRLSAWESPETPWEFLTLLCPFGHCHLIELDSLGYLSHLL